MAPSHLLTEYSMIEYSIFGSQLRDDFQPVFLIWLTPFPDSLAVFRFTRSHQSY